MIVTQTVMPAAAAATKRRILVVEDEAAIREVVRLHLSLAGFEVTEVGDGVEALKLARSTPFGLILLDVLLPGLDGVTLCRALRSEGASVNTPIMMLTALDTESDKVLGLESGADDYLAKPFGVRELVARVAAILRRSSRGDGPDPRDSGRIASPNLILDAERRAASLRGQAVELTKQEFDVLYLLAARPGIVFSRGALLTKVWGGDTYVTERTVDTVVSRLRKKLERDAQDPELILTAWGVGYKFVDGHDDGVEQ